MGELNPLASRESEARQTGLPPCPAVVLRFCVIGWEHFKRSTELVKADLFPSGLWCVHLFHFAEHQVPTYGKVAFPCYLHWLGNDCRARTMCAAFLSACWGQTDPRFYVQAFCTPHIQHMGYGQAHLQLASGTRECKTWHEKHSFFFLSHKNSVIECSHLDIWNKCLPNQIAV